LRSLEISTLSGAPLRPLLGKELREITAGRAIWILLLLICPLIGYSFQQAVTLYGEASTAALQSPVLAASLSPLDGILVPTFGAFYVAITLLFPFVAIRTLGQEKESGALCLLIQLPYRASTLILAKFTAVLAAWLLASVPALSALVLWRILGGHLSGPETLNLILGHLLYGLLIGAVALFCASISEGATTAAIIALAVTIGSWVLDFTVAGQPGRLGWLSHLSLTEALRLFEQGLLSVGLVSGICGIIAGLIALTSVWLPPGISPRRKLVRSIPCALAMIAVLGVAAQLRATQDVTEDQRNSFPSADQRLLATLPLTLSITVHLVPEDPRYADLRRNVLSKLDRSMRNVSIRLSDHRRPASKLDDDNYGIVEYSYGARSDTSRSTSPREILPLLYALAAIPPPAPDPAPDYSGYPLIADGNASVIWFFGGLPALTAVAWWLSRHQPGSVAAFAQLGGST